MGTALLLTGVSLLYGALSEQTPARHPWMRLAGALLCVGGTCAFAWSHGPGAGVASALALIMAWLSLLALVVPLSPKRSWLVVEVVLAGLWLYVVGSWA
ncbi:hypothetical protein [Chondromyces crocatus]|uniref:DUF3325 domain-containing protein n=1 Tax=Chondromyces crocatus TaxID=52 RepID=A0A0K1EBH1_CHOCO|nr:hypothetical protein [Chondromyces crocatus]AKT38194.1 uncharacterized protein CMC5_023370 [Chondromyces crocatus]